MKHTGSCLCKKVVFEINGQFEAFFFCHCSRCRKVTGSAHGANLFSKSASFNWISGQELVKTFELQGTRFVKSFCGECGSALPHVGPSRMVVPAGSLDCDVDLKPNGHIFMGSRANWDKDFELLPRFNDFPK